MQTRLHTIVGFVMITLMCGCMRPYNYYGNPYQQPMYGPPANLSPQPGTLYIPPSNAPPYDPQGGPSTYDEPTDTWSNPGSATDSRFFGEDADDNPVPNPRDPGSGSSTEPFEGDFNSGF